MKRSRSKPWLVLLGLFALGAGVGVYAYVASKKRPVTKEATQIVAVRRGPLTVEVSATGTVEPEYVVEIKSKASGTIQSVKVQAGDVVKKGDLLIEIDPVIERRKLTQAEADLAVASANRGGVATKLAHAQTQLERDEELHTKGLVSREAIDQLRKELAILRGDTQISAAQISKARASLAEARDRLAETKILSPLDGTILDRSVNPGQVITAGTAQGGQTLLTLADLSRLFVRVKVDEADVARLAPGQRVRITADALIGKVFKGKVLRVSPQGKVESSVTVFDVVVEVDPAEVGLLRPMLSANVVIHVDEIKDAVLLPRNAVQQRGARFVVRVEGKGEQVVEVGLSDDRQIQIKSGLEEGARVVVPSSPKAKSSTRMPGMPGMPGGMGAMPPGGGMGRR
ncbi:MAG: efflux RND transporter periplasmic adaptor subunit [Deltaproteobacteria bacterium]|nr:efflux RND transporter periplasmic adaptor subunit [Deltaproteobacteria bacterium]